MPRQRDRDHRAEQRERHDQDHRRRARSSSRTARRAPGRPAARPARRRRSPRRRPASPGTTCRSTRSPSTAAACCAAICSISCERLARAVAGRGLAGDRRRTGTGCSGWMICGPSVSVDVDERAERHHLRLRRCGPRAARCRPASSAELRLGLHAHLVRAAELVEVVHVGRAEVRLQRAEDAVERDAERLRPSRGRRRRRAAARRRGTSS